MQLLCYHVNQIPNCWCPHVVCGLCSSVPPSQWERQSKTTPSSHLVLFPGVGSRDEERLVRDLFRGYNKLIRPVENMTQKVEVAFGLAFIQLINVVSISSSSFSSFAMIPPMELLGGKPAWQLFFIISNCVKAIVYEQMSNDRMNKEENKVIFAIHQAQG